MKERYRNTLELEVTVGNGRVTTWMFGKSGASAGRFDAASAMRAVRLGCWIPISKKQCGG